MWIYEGVLCASVHVQVCLDFSSVVRWVISPPIPPLPLPDINCIRAVIYGQITGCKTHYFLMETGPGEIHQIASRTVWGSLYNSVCVYGLPATVTDGNCTITQLHVFKHPTRPMFRSTSQGLTLTFIQRCPCLNSRQDSKMGSERPVFTLKYILCSNTNLSMTKI